MQVHHVARVRLPGPVSSAPSNNRSGVPALESISVVHTAPVTKVAFGVAGQA